MFIEIKEIKGDKIALPPSGEETLIGALEPVVTQFYN